VTAGYASLAVTIVRRARPGMASASWWPSSVPSYYVRRRVRVRDGAACDNGLGLRATGTSPKSQALLVAPPPSSGADDGVTLDTRFDAATHQL
jgi:hypothetical protein